MFNARIAVSEAAGSDPVLCQLATQGGGVDAVTLQASASSQFVPLLGTKTTTADGFVSVACQIATNPYPGNVASRKVSITQVRITAVRLGSAS